MPRHNHAPRRQGGSGNGETGYGNGNLSRLIANGIIADRERWPNILPPPPPPILEARPYRMTR